MCDRWRRFPPLYALEKLKLRLLSASVVVSNTTGDIGPEKVIAMGVRMPALAEALSGLTDCNDSSFMMKNHALVLMSEDTESLPGLMETRFLSFAIKPIKLQNTLSE